MEVEKYRHPFCDGCKNLPDDRDEELKQIKDWYATQPHLPQVSDEYLHLFLHSNYYNLEATQKNIETYFTMRSTWPEVFGDRCPTGPALLSVWDIMYYAVLDQRTPEGYQVCIFQLSDPDINKFDHINMIKAMTLLQDCMISENGLCPGYVIVQSMTNQTFSHFLKQNHAQARKTMKYVQEALPVRLKTFHALHAPSFMDYVFNFFKAFMSKQLIELFHIHRSDFTEFYKFVPQEILPKEFGGSNGTLQSHTERTLHLLKSKYEKWPNHFPMADMSKHPKNAPRKSFFSFW